MEHGGKEQGALLHPEDGLEQHQVARAGHGQKFAKALYQAQEHGQKNIHASIIPVPSLPFNRPRDGRLEEHNEIFVNSAKTVSQNANLAVYFPDGLLYN